MVVKKSTKRQVKRATKRQVKQATKPERVKKSQVAKRIQVKRIKTSTTKRSSYSIEQKKKVVAYAERNGRNEAARHFQLNGSMIGRWIKASENWTTETRRHYIKVGCGRKAFYPEAEKKLYT